MTKKTTVLLDTLERRIGLVLFAAGAAVSATDTHQLPPKWAAGVATAGAVIAVAQRVLAQVEQSTGSFFGKSAAPTLDLAAPDPADPNAPTSGLAQSPHA